MISHLTVEPEDEPLSLDEAKKQVQLESAEDDSFLSLVLIPAARRHVEAYCNRGIIEQTWEAVLDAFPHQGHPLYLNHSCCQFGYGGVGLGYGPGGQPCRACHLWIELPHGQLADLGGDPAVESIKYIDQAGVEQTLATSEYSVDAVSVPPRVHLAFGKSWPQARRQWDAVKIVYTVGWTVETVPESVKQAIALLVSQLYENRTPEVDAKALAPVAFSLEALLSPHRLLYL